MEKFLSENISQRFRTQVTQLYNEGTQCHLFRKPGASQHRHNVWVDFTCRRRSHSREEVRAADLASIHTVGYTVLGVLVSNAVLSTTSVLRKFRVHARPSLHYPTFLYSVCASVVLPCDALNDINRQWEVLLKVLPALSNLGREETLPLFCPPTGVVSTSRVGMLLFDRSIDRLECAKRT